MEEVFIICALLKREAGLPSGKMGEDQGMLVDWNRSDRQGILWLVIFFKIMSQNQYPSSERSNDLNNESHFRIFLGVKHLNIFS